MNFKATIHIPDNEVKLIGNLLELWRTHKLLKYNYVEWKFAMIHL